MGENEARADPAWAWAVRPLLVEGDPKAEFCADDPRFVNRPMRLWMKVNCDYKGLVLGGPCPRCTHVDGIDLFLPTTWASITPSGGLGVADLAFKAQLLPTAEAARYLVVGWLSDTSEPRAGADEYVEVIVCRCGLEHVHQPPSGRSGCGFWAYLHLPKEAIGDVQPAR